MLDKKNKVLFIHIPRTGGTSIERLIGLPFTPDNLCGVINNKALQHMTAKEIRNRIGADEFNYYWKFSVVRHPYTRMVSEFHWRPKVQVRQFPKLKFGSNFIQFLTRVKSIVKNNKYSDSVFHDHFIPQYKYLTIDDDDKLVTDYVIRFENLVSEFEVVKEKLGSDKSLIKCQSSGYSNMDSRSILTPKAKKLIQEIYAKDFELFGFSV